MILKENLNKEIQENLRVLTNALLSIYTQPKGFELKDIMNASFIFSSVLFDVVYHNNNSEDKKKVVKQMGKDIRKLIIKYAGVDPHKHNDLLF